MNITDEWVRAVAPNAAAVRNGHALAGRFDSLRVSPDNTLLSGDCQGSGNTPYAVCADLTVPETPVFQCTCPSRQKPCKHVLGLLFAFIGSPESFIPGSGMEEPATRRVEGPRLRRRNVQSVGKPEPAQMTLQLEETVITPAADTRKRAALQTEGLDLALRMAASLVTEGLGAQDARKLAELRTRAHALGNYYVPGVQNAFLRVLRALGEHGDGLRGAFEEISIFYSLCLKARDYFTRKLDEPELLDAALETWCGRVWSLAELGRMGLGITDARLIQMAFFSRDDLVTGMLEDTGYWALLDGGGVRQASLCLTQSLRPRQALAHIREEDSCFGVVQTPVLYRYPSGLRVRWDEFTLGMPGPDDYAALTAAAEPLSGAIRRLRETLRDPLGLGNLPSIVRMDALETSSGCLWLVCGEDRLPLVDAPSAPAGLLPLLLNASHKAAFVQLNATTDGNACGEVLALLSDTGITRTGG